MGNKEEKISLAALKKALQKREIFLPDNTIIDIAIESGLGAVREIKDFMREDKSYWAELYSSQIAEKAQVSPLSTYYIIAELETALLDDLYRKRGYVTIPHICELLIRTTKDRGVRIIMKELFTPVRDKIEEIVYSRELAEKVKLRALREKRSKNGHSRIA